MCEDPFFELPGARKEKAEEQGAPAASETRRCARSQYAVASEPNPPSSHSLRRALNDQDIAVAAEQIEDNILTNALDGIIEEVEYYLNSAFGLPEK